MTKRTVPTDSFSALEDLLQIDKCQASATNVEEGILFSIPDGVTLQNISGGRETDSGNIVDERSTSKVNPFYIPPWSATSESDNNVELPTTIISLDEQVESTSPKQDPCGHYSEREINTSPQTILKRLSRHLFCDEECENFNCGACDQNCSIYSDIQPKIEEESGLPARKVRLINLPHVYPLTEPTLLQRPMMANSPDVRDNEIRNIATVKPIKTIVYPIAIENNGFIGVQNDESTMNMEQKPINTKKASPIAIVEGKRRIEYKPEKSTSTNIVKTEKDALERGKKIFDRQYRNNQLLAEKLQLDRGSSQVFHPVKLEKCAKNKQLKEPEVICQRLTRSMSRGLVANKNISENNDQTKKPKNPKNNFLCSVKKEAGTECVTKKNIPTHQTRSYSVGLQVRKSVSPKKRSRTFKQEPKDDSANAASVKVEGGILPEKQKPSKISNLCSPPVSTPRNALTMRLRSSSRQQDSKQSIVLKKEVPPEDSIDQRMTRSRSARINVGRANNQRKKSSQPRQGLVTQRSIKTEPSNGNSQVGPPPVSDASPRRLLKSNRHASQSLPIKKEVKRELNNETQPAITNSSCKREITVPTAFKPISPHAQGSTAKSETPNRYSPLISYSDSLTESDSDDSLESDSSVESVYVPPKSFFVKKELEDNSDSEPSLRVTRSHSARKKMIPARYATRSSIKIKASNHSKSAATNVFHEKQRPGFNRECSKPIVIKTEIPKRKTKCTLQSRTSPKLLKLWNESSPEVGNNHFSRFDTHLPSPPSPEASSFYVDSSNENRPYVTRSSFKNNKKLKRNGECSNENPTFVPKQFIKEEMEDSEYVNESAEESVENSQEGYNGGSNNFEQGYNTKDEYSGGNRPKLAQKKALSSWKSKESLNSRNLSQLESSFSSCDETGFNSANVSPGESTPARSYNEMAFSGGNLSQGERSPSGSYDVETGFIDGNLSPGGSSAAGNYDGNLPPERSSSWNNDETRGTYESPPCAKSGEYITNACLLLDQDNTNQQLNRNIAKPCGRRQSVYAQPPSLEPEEHVAIAGPSTGQAIGGSLSTINVGLSNSRNISYAPFEIMEVTCDEIFQLNLEKCKEDGKPTSELMQCVAQRKDSPKKAKSKGKGDKAEVAGKNRTIFEGKALRGNRNKTVPVDVGHKLVSKQSVPDDENATADLEVVRKTRLKDKFAEWNLFECSNTVRSHQVKCDCIDEPDGLGDMLLQEIIDRADKCRNFRPVKRGDKSSRKK